MLLKCTLLYFSLREMFKDIAFVYISDDLGWGKQKLEKKARLRNFDLYFVGDSSKSENRDRDRDRWDIIHCENFLQMIQYVGIPVYNVFKRFQINFSIGHDLALMSLCNHTIISHGTFSEWAGYFAGGSVIRPEHFAKYR